MNAPRVEAGPGADRKLNRRDPLQVVVTSNGERIGTMTTGAFMAAHPAPHGTFLSENVAKFNEWKERIGEPERVFVEIRR